MLESRGGAKNSQYVEGSGKQTGETVEQVARLGSKRSYNKEVWCP